MAKKPTDALHQAAEAALKKHPSSIADAAKVLAADLERKGDLRFSLSLWFLKAVAPKTQPSRHKAGPHRRPQPLKGPTARQKAGALRAEHAYTNDIFARR